MSLLDLPSQLSGNGPVRLEFPVGETYDGDVAALLSNEEAMTHLVAMSKASSGGWSESDARLRRERQEKEFCDGVSLNGIVFYANEFAGIAGFREINLWSMSAEMGIILHPKYWNKGISTHVHFLCLKYAYEVAGINRVEFKTTSSNLAMRKFCTETLSATHEGTLRDYFPAGTADSAFVNVELYSILASEWPALKQRIQEKIS